MSSQVLFAVAINLSSQSNCTFLNSWIAGSSQINSEPMVVGGSLTDWYISLATAPGVGSSRTFTLQKNDVNTAITITISGTNTTGSYIGSVSWAANDTIRFNATSTGAPANTDVRSAILWTPDNDGDFIYGWSTGSNLDLNRNIPIVGGFGGSILTFTGSNNVATAGNITKHRCKVRTAPGAGTSRIFHIVKNGVKQDGTGGTVDTTVTISDTDVAATSTFTLPVVAGDVLAVTSSVSGSPAAISWWGGSLVFVPTVTGQYFTVFTGDNAATDGTTEYAYPHGGRFSSGWITTVRELIGHTTSFYVNRMQIEISGAPGAGKSWTFTLQVNGVDTGLTKTISGATDTTGFVTVGTPIEIGPSDLWQLKVVSAGTPSVTTSESRISLGMTIIEPVTEKSRTYMMLVA